MNNSNSNFQVTLDANDPSATITEPGDTTIKVSNSIKYTCDCSDATSAVKSCTTKLTKPGGDVITKTGDNTEHTFTGTDTSEAGEYTVSCEVEDTVGHRASAGTKRKFTSSYSVSGAGGGAAGGGGGTGGGAVTTITEAIESGVTKDVGALTETQVTQISEGGAVSFAIGTTTHKAKVISVGTDSVTVEVSSTPKQVTVKIGETKEIDANDDGTNELAIILNGITNGKADITFKNLLAPPTEEVTTTTIAPTEVVTGEEKTSLTWLWIVIAIIIIVIILVLIRKKK